MFKVYINFSENLSAGKFDRRKNVLSENLVSENLLSEKPPGTPVYMFYNYDLYFVGLA